MKLARPDIFHPRIVLAGDPPAPGETAGRVDDAGLIAALRHRGLHARSLAWDDPDTLDAHLVILRAVHPQVTAAPGFGAWTRRVAHLLNAPGVLAWNLRPGYLDDLAAAGVPVAAAPTAGEQAAGAQVALIFFGGERSHDFGPSAATGAEWAVGEAALAAAANRLRIGADELLYARVDVTAAPGGPVLRRLDLVGPRLGWRSAAPEVVADGERRFALAVEAALDRLGLGPLTHRRP